MVSVVSETGYKEENAMSGKESAFSCVDLHRLIEDPSITPEEIERLSDQMKAHIASCVPCAAFVRELDAVLLSPTVLAAVRWRAAEERGDIAPTAYNIRQAILEVERDDHLGSCPKCTPLLQPVEELLRSSSILQMDRDCPCEKRFFPLWRVFRIAIRHIEEEEGEKKVEGKGA